MWIFKKIGWKFLAAGAAAAVVGAPYVRPAAVGLVKAGLEAKDLALNGWEQAKTHASAIAADAAAMRKTGSASASASSSDEVAKLHEEIAALKSQLAHQGA